MFEFSKGVGVVYRFVHAPSSCLSVTMITDFSVYIRFIFTKPLSITLTLKRSLHCPNTELIRKHFLCSNTLQNFPIGDESGNYLRKKFKR